MGHEKKTPVKIPRVFFSLSLMSFDLTHHKTLVACGPSGPSELELYLSAFIEGFNPSS